MQFNMKNFRNLLFFGGFAWALIWAAVVWCLETDTGHTGWAILAFIMAWLGLTTVLESFFIQVAIWYYAVCDHFRKKSAGSEFDPNCVSELWPDHHSGVRR
jgi:hypothetical protein